MPIASVNPATGELLKSFSELTELEVDHAIDRAWETFRKYRATSFAERAKSLCRAAEILDAEKRALGTLMTQEMGKPLKAAIDEAGKCAWVCRYYAEHAERFLADVMVETNASRSYITYQPLGPVLAVMPWNFPFWQVFRFAAPALMAGNVGLLKHASNVPQCALAIEDVFHRAGFPEGCFQTLLVGAALVPRILEDPRIKAATLTGSEPAGSTVASLAGKLIKKTVLELGGSDPFIVMPGADIGDAAATAVRARTINNGQSCIAAKRFIVHEHVYNEFAEQFVQRMEALRIGDPMDETTDIGPLASETLLEQLDAQVKESILAGARLLCGGRRLTTLGSFYLPTVLADIPVNSPAYCEELFGPVALLFRVSSVDEAIRLANDTPFGLASSAWTKDPDEQNRFIGEIEAGAVFINGMVASDPRLPFGGVKRSGYGRELSLHGILEFVNIKTIWIKETQGTAVQKTE